MRLRFFYSDEPAAFAYAVYGEGKPVLRSPLYRARYGTHDIARLPVMEKEPFLLTEPVPHYVLINRFFLGGQRYLLLTCLPQEELSAEEGNVALRMQAVPDLFRAVLSCTDSRETTPTLQLLRALQGELCLALRNRFSAEVEESADPALAATASLMLDREGFMMTVGFLVPHLLGGRRLTVAAEAEGDTLAITLTADKTVTNPFHRALAAAVGQACGFTVTFPENGIRFSMAACAPTSALLSSGILYADEDCMSIGAMLYEEEAA